MKNIIFFYFLVNLFVKQPNLKKKNYRFPPLFLVSNFTRFSGGKKKYWKLFSILIQIIHACEFIQREIFRTD